MPGEGDVAAHAQNDVGLPWRMACKGLPETRARLSGNSSSLRRMPRSAENRTHHLEAVAAPAGLHTLPGCPARRPPAALAHGFSATPAPGRWPPVPPAMITARHPGMVDFGYGAI